MDEEQLIKKIRAQVLEELRDEENRKKAEQEIIKEKATQSRNQYVEAMKQSNEPWVEVVSWGETETGANIELDWNDAFVKYLKDNGMIGASEEQIVQKWITYLLHELSSTVEPTKTEFE